MNIFTLINKWTNLDYLTLKFNLYNNYYIIIRDYETLRTTISRSNEFETIMKTCWNAPVKNLRKQKK